MPRKSTAPYLGPPAWLDVAAERPIAVEPFADRTAFCVATMRDLSLIHISEPTRPCGTSRMPSSA